MFGVNYPRNEAKSLTTDELRKIPAQGMGPTASSVFPVVPSIFCPALSNQHSTNALLLAARQPRCDRSSLLDYLSIITCRSSLTATQEF
jgi:hypothetical protein